MSFSSEVKEEVRNNRFTSKKRHSKITDNELRHRMTQQGRIIDAFLRSGSVSDPEKSYHLEILCESGQEAEELRAAAEAFGIHPGISRRKERYVVYLKDSSSVSDMLAVLGATNALLSLNNVVALKDIKGRVQRRVNCDTANISKAVSASARQTEDIELIMKKGGFAGQSEGLKELAELRLMYPEATLTELSEHLPGVSKSGINHRFRRIAKIAEHLRTEELL